jgi:uncharacterized membrane protein
MAFSNLAVGQWILIGFLALFVFGVIYAMWRELGVTRKVKVVLTLAIVVWAASGFWKVDLRGHVLALCAIALLLWLGDRFAAIEQRLAALERPAQEEHAAESPLIWSPK